MLTRVVADEWGYAGVRGNSVLPGLILTGTAAPLTENVAVREGFMRQTPLGRLGEPADLARCIAFLLSDDANLFAGQCWGVDGGLSLRGIPAAVRGDVLRELILDFFPDAE